MASWHSLAGYLVLRPAGALSRLKARKRLWYVFDEGCCQLLYYKSETDAHSKEPLGVINVRGAAISLTLEESNQFVIHSEGKEHVLVADNHESMMLWVLALQARQDSAGGAGQKDNGGFAAYRQQQLGKKGSSANDLDVQAIMERTKSIANRNKILRTHSLQLHDKDKEENARQHNTLTRMRSLLVGQSMESDFSERDRPLKPQLSTVVQSIDIDDDSEDENQDTAETLTSGRGVSSPSTSTSSDPGTTTPVSPSAAMAITTDNNNNDHDHSTPPKSPSDLCRIENESTDHSSDTESCDESDPSDAFERDDGVEVEGRSRSPGPPAGTRDRVRLLRKMNSDGIRPEDLSPLKDRASSLSGTSVSSDSAVGTSECAHSIRLQDLESELMSTKCELAKALNRESVYKNIIEEKIAIVSELEDRLKTAEDPSDDFWKPSNQKAGNSSSSGSHKLHEKCRILQNHNRFLNEEVLKLSRMLQQEQKTSHLKQLHIQRMEGENDQLKRDYVFLLQSSLRITSTDGPETMEVYLYGGARHKQRVLSLLEEARRINPTLPAYESLTRSMCHVDAFGFRRTYSDEGLILHYICRQLHQHYCTLVPGYDIHQQHWKRYLRQYPSLPRTKELKCLVRVGIPAHLRSRVWAALYRSRVRDIMDDKGSHYYSYLCSLAPDDERVSLHKRQIALDLLRTMPDNIRFSDANADGVRKMQEVLQAFCLHNPSLGYCQGMNFLVGMCLLFLEPEDAFWCLVAITEKYFTPNYFDQNLIGAQADQEVLKDLLREKMPILWHHFERLDIELCTITLNWFLAIFFDCIPFETLLRIWDCFLLEGPKVLFRFSLAILKMNEKAILAKHDTVSIMRQLKAAAKLCFDVESLFKTAFEGLKPFTRRQDIAAKQACYYKTLKEHAKKMEMEKVALKDRERMLSEMEILGANQWVIECAAVYDKDKLWLCHGHQNGAQISKVNCEESIMYRLNIELESRVMCMHALDDDTMLLGTLSHFVHAYSTKSRRLMWETRLNDSALALSSHEEDGLKQVYAGLADGTIAVIENIQGHAAKPETFYIMIGSSPVTCIRLVDRRLWCGSGNRIIILSARTLDAVDQFQTSSSVLDYISMLVPDEQGVWVTIRGSSVLQLWDSRALTCKLLYDVKDNRYPRSPKQSEDDTNVNQARITAVLPFGGSVLVGTAEGSLIIYDIVTRLSRSASSADFACRRQLEGATVDHIQERIQELLLEQKKRDLVDEKSFSDVRHRIDSGCYTTPSRTPLLALSRRESMHVPDCLPTPLEQEYEQESPEGSPEDRSETTSGSTVRRVGTDLSVNSPESQLCGEAEEFLLCDVTTPAMGPLPPEEPCKDPFESSANEEKIHESNADVIYEGVDKGDSGRSSSSTHGKALSEAEDTTTAKTVTKRPCTCNQLSSKTLKCRHCLLETSEALRKLFSKYSLSTSTTNHMDSATRYQNLINSSKSRNILWQEEKHRVEEHEENLEKDADSSDSSSQGSIDLMTNNKDEEDCNDDYENECEISSELSKNNQKFTSSLFDMDRAQPGSKHSSLLRAISADDVTRWIKSQENSSSSFASDSYDFDDVFVAYTEDEANSKIGSGTLSLKSGVYRSKDTEALLQSIRTRALAGRRSSNIFDYTPSYTSPSLSYRTDWSSRWHLKSRSTSPWINTSATSVSSSSVSQGNCNINRLKLADIRTQLPPWCRESILSESEVGAAVKGKPSDNVSGRNATSPTNWLSYEDSVTENDSVKGGVSRDLLQLGGDWSSGTQKGSDTASNVSFSSTEVPYTFELNLQEKIKISDKPIKCLLETRCGGEATIISCAGCYGDDEAVLKWTKLGDEKLWTNDPIIEVCPYTNAIKPSPYARSRLPRRTSSLASVNTESDCTARASRSSVTSTSSSASSVVGSGLAKVQNMFLRVHDKA